MNESRYSKVLFSEISESYATDAHIECRFYTHASLAPHDHDRIGLFRVGWTEPSQCLLSKRMTDCHTDNEFGERRLTFSASELPKDAYFYQFCYLTANDEMCGASTPFRLARPHEEDLIELNQNHCDEDFVVVRSQQALLQERLEQMANANAVLEYSKRALEQQIASANEELNELRHLKVEYEDRLKLTAMELNRFQDNANRAEENNRNVTEHIEKLEHDLVEMKKIRTDQDLRLEKWQIEMMAMSSKLNSAQLRDSSLAQQLTSRDNQNAHLTKKTADQQVIIDELKSKFAFIESELEVSRASIAKIMSERRDLDAENKMLRNEMLDIKAKCDTLEANKDIMMSEICDLERKKLKYGVEIKCTLENMEELRRQLSQSETMQSVSTNEWRVKEDEMRKQLADMRARLSQAAHEYHQLYQRNTKLEAKLERIKSKVKFEKKKVDTKSKSSVKIATPLEVQQMIAANEETEVKTVVESDLSDLAAASVDTANANSDHLESITLVSLPCTICRESIVCTERDLKPMTTHLEAKHSQRLCPVCSMLFDLKIQGADNYFQMHVENHFDVPNSGPTAPNYSAF